MDRAFRICMPFVVSEVLEGEAVIMDLRTGYYFSATGAGALIWQGLEAEHGLGRILQSLTARYAIDAQPLADAVDRFLADLLANNLVEERAAGESNGADSQADGAGAASMERGVFEPPVLAMHTDLQDLLLLDPIHDVDSAGWPTRKK